MCWTLQKRVLSAEINVTLSPEVRGRAAALEKNL